MANTNLSRITDSGVTANNLYSCKSLVAEYLIQLLREAGYNKLMDVDKERINIKLFKAPHRNTFPLSIPKEKLTFSLHGNYFIRSGKIVNYDLIDELVDTICNSTNEIEVICSFQFEKVNKGIYIQNGNFSYKREGNSILFMVPKDTYVNVVSV